MAPKKDKKDDNRDSRRKSQSEGNLKKTRNIACDKLHI
jgi:hypothetical protein